MKKAYILISVLLLAAVGCNRENVPGTPDSAKKLTITAGASTRSHFDTDGLSLLWDADDKIQLYSLSAGTMTAITERATELAEAGLRGGDFEQGLIAAGLEALAHNIDYDVTDVLSIDPSGIGERNARFTSLRDVEDWFGVTDPTDDHPFIFAALYPARATQKPLNVFRYTGLGDFSEELEPIDEIDVIYLPVEIPAVQDGRSYWKYQLLAGSPDEVAPLEDGIAFYDAVCANPTLTISEMAPLTSLLAFTIQLSPDSDIASCGISKISIQVETEEEYGEGYVSGTSFVAGELPYFPNWDEVHEIRLWNRISLPIMTGNSRYQRLNEETWDAMANASTTLSLQFAEPVTVAKDAPTTETFYAVLAPTNNRLGPDEYPFACPRYIVTAYNAADEEILHATLKTVNQWGLMEGHKYTFNLLLGDYSAPQTMLFDGNAGEYGHDNWN